MEEVTFPLTDEDLKIITDPNEMEKAEWELQHAKVTTLEASQKAINNDIEMHRAELEVQFQEKMDHLQLLQLLHQKTLF